MKQVASVLGDAHDVDHVAAGSVYPRSSNGVAVELLSSGSP